MTPTTPIRALLVEDIHPVGVQALTDLGWKVTTQAAALTEPELLEALDGIDVLGIRSTSHVTEAVLDSAPQLAAIGAFCIGTNQIDQDAATRRGLRCMSTDVPPTAGSSETRSLPACAPGRSSSTSPAACSSTSTHWLSTCAAAISRAPHWTCSTTSQRPANVIFALLPWVVAIYLLKKFGGLTLRADPVPTSV
jgi:hypothetical protein